LCGCWCQIHHGFCPDGSGRVGLFGALACGLNRSRIDSATSPFVAFSSTLTHGLVRPPITGHSLRR
jgi:hypothetical protein